MTDKKIMEGLNEAGQYYFQKTKKPCEFCKSSQPLVKCTNCQCTIEHKKNSRAIGHICFDCFVDLHGGKDNV